MKEIVLEIIRAGKERLKYPIITIYMIVLILWNWEVLSVYLFSSKPIETRILYIQTQYTDQWGRVLWPFCKAVLLAIGVPLLMWGLEFVLHKINGGRRLIKNVNNKAIREDKLDAARTEFYIQEARTGTKTIEQWEDRVASVEVSLNTALEANNRHMQELVVVKDLHGKEIQDLNNKIANAEDEIEAKAQQIATALIIKFEDDNEFKGSTMLYLREIFDMTFKKDKTNIAFGDDLMYPDLTATMYTKMLNTLNARGLVTIHEGKITVTLLGAAVYARLCDMITE